MWNTVTFPALEGKCQNFTSNPKSVWYVQIAPNGFILSQQKFWNMFESKPNILIHKNQLRKKYFDYLLDKYEK